MGSTISLRFTSEIWHNTVVVVLPPSMSNPHTLLTSCAWKYYSGLSLMVAPELLAVECKLNCSERYKIVPYTTVLAKNATGRSLCITDCIAGVAQLQLVRRCSDHKDVCLWTKFTLILLHWLAINVVHILNLPQGYFETIICKMFLKMVAVCLNAAKPSQCTTEV